MTTLQEVKGRQLRLSPKNMLDSPMGEWLSKQRESQESCRSLPFVLAFYTVFMLTQLAHFDVQTVYGLQTSLTNALTTGTTPAPMPQNVVRPSACCSLPHVKSWADALTWIDETVIPVLWAEAATATTSSGAVMGLNHIIGGARLQQYRLKTQDCPGPEGLAESYRVWMAKYNRTCYSTVPGNYDDTPIDAVTVNSVSQGAEADGTGAYTYWLDADQSQDQVWDHIKALRDARWLGISTEKLRIQSAIQSGQAAMFVIVEITLTLDRVGAMIYSIKVKALNNEVYNKVSTLIGDLLFFLMLFWLFTGELFGALKAIKDREIAEHFCSFFRLLNWAVIFFGGGFVCFFGFLANELGDLSSTVADLLESTTSITSMHDDLDAAYEDIASLSTKARYYEFATFWYSLLLLMMFFKGFQANPRLAIITETLRKALPDLTHFLLIFSLVFTNFVVGAYFLFGQQVKEWSSISFSANTGFRALMGDFDFIALYNIAPFAATVWFWTYMSLIFLIMINMLLAIVMDSYASVKGNAEKSDTIFQVFAQWTLQHMNKMLGRLPQKARRTSRIHSIRASIQSMAKIVSRGSDAGAGDGLGRTTREPREDLALEIRFLRDCMETFKAGRPGSESSPRTQASGKTQTRSQRTVMSTVGEAEPARPRDAPVEQPPAAAQGGGNDAPKERRSLSVGPPAATAAQHAKNNRSRYPVAHIADGWEWATDASSGFVYYYNRETGARQWQPPTNGERRPSTEHSKAIGNQPGGATTRSASHPATVPSLPFSPEEAGNATAARAFPRPPTEPRPQPLAINVRRQPPTAG